MQIVVIDPLRVVRRSIVEEIGEACQEFDAWDTFDEWLEAGHAGDRVVAVLSLIEELDLDRTKKVASRPGLDVVALLDRTSSEQYQAAIRAGAVSVLPRDAEPSAVKAAVEALVTGWSMLPVAEVRTMGRRLARSAPAANISVDELAWLRMLADGTTIAVLADKVGYSEREMFRLLGHLYRRLGAESRTEALVNAARAGLLDPTGDGVE
jgi:DNA-binding NarL/FixJ family response regulator